MKEDSVISLKKKHAIILCSGGLDSVTTAHYVNKKLNYKLITILFFNYGQKSIKEERKSAKLCAKDLNAIFMEISLPELKKISTSLINIHGKINSLSFKDLKNTKKESKKWYVPARNLIFISYALSLSDSIFIENNEKCSIFLGFKCEGKDSYPDTTKHFIQLMNKLSKSSTASRPLILSPLIEKDKEDIIKLAYSLNVSLNKTFSCYSPKNRKHCGFCLACKLRQAGFYWSGIKDNTEYYYSQNNY